MLLKLETKKTKLCAHPALNSTGPDRWQCALCGAELTALDLIKQRNERRQKRGAAR